MKVEGSDFTVEWKWDALKIYQIQMLIDGWIEDNEIFDAETLFQVDRGLIESPNLVADIIGVLDPKVEWKNDNTDTN